MAGENKVRERRKAARPAEIIEAAFEEFTRHGYAGTRLEDVAKLAGVTKGTIYVYFPDKEQLFHAVMRKYWRRIPDDMRQLHGIPEKPAAAFLRSFLRLVYQTMQADRQGREIFRLIVAEAERFPALVDEYHREVIEPVLEKLRGILDEAAQRGEIRRSAVLEFPDIVLAPAALMHLWLLIFSNRRPFDADRFLEAHLDLVLHGLVADTAAQPD